MYKIFTCLVFSLAVCFIGSSQVGIGTNTPNASSILELQSINKGLLVPRVTAIQRNAITTPANGLIVFDLDSSSLFIYTQTVWKRMKPVSILENLVVGITNGDMIMWNGTAWEIKTFRYSYRDKDGDGYGDRFQPLGSFISFPGFVNDSTDCNDNDPTVNPTKIWYRDQDNDGYGSASVTTNSCRQPSGYVSNNNDCNDNNSSIHPGAIDDNCDGIDDDCDGQIDEDVIIPWFPDGDGDGYGSPYLIVHACTQPAGMVSNSQDCNDSNPNIHPGATEICNGLDDDCDGQIDESGSTVYYLDQDGDGYGNIAATTTACNPPTGYVSNNLDCNDSDPNVNPAATDLPDDAFIDSDCDGIDGKAAAAIFVTTTGNNSNPGTKALPVASINTALSLAVNSGKTQVYISNGIYNERIILINGISLYGGYSAVNNWNRSASNISTITGSNTSGRMSGVEGTNITLSTTIDRLVITTPNVTSNLLNNYGIICNSCSGVTLKNSTVNAGNGGSGLPGSNGSTGAAGGNGGNGAQGNCDNNVVVPGGAGGSSACGRSGGNGGNGGGGPNYGNNGGIGVGGTSPGAGGAPGDPAGDPGGNGVNGLNGGATGNGAGGSGGFVSGSFWVSNPGNGGLSGTVGNGGGGGGGGGGQDLFIGFEGSGNGGGGGGAGGCGGTAGSGGSAGGGSFGLFLVSSTGFQIISNTISSGNGGTGGNGGVGGNGGAGGLGGAGGSTCIAEVGRGGIGGNGGNGGNGGHGGGGAGGPTYSIYRFSTTLSTSGNILSFGTPGAGGNSAGSAGAAGGSGTIF